MKKTKFTLVLFMLIGLLTGTIVAHLLSSVQAIDFLTKGYPITWHPQADLDFIRYDLTLVIKVSLLSIIGLIAGYWLHRKV